jgi:hypothetical protein
MARTVSKWHAVPDIDSPFGSIQYSFEADFASVRMIGERTLALRFSGVVALRFEQECPGFDFPPLPLPMLTPSHTFPLLRVDESPWLEQFTQIYGEIFHFALVSSDHLFQVLAKSDVEARWETEKA